MQSVDASADRPIVFLVDKSAHYHQVMWQVFNESLPDYELRSFTGGISLPDPFIPDGQMALLLINSQTQSVDSLELVKRLKQQIRWKHIPIVVISSEACADQVAAYYEAGANSFAIASAELKPIQQLLQSLCSYWFSVHHHAAYI